MKTVFRWTLPCLMLCATSLHAEMQLYEVNFQYRQEVYQALSEILESDQAGKENYGQVEMLPTGQILVDAPEDTQKQVARVIAAIDQQENDPPPSVTLRYWILLAGDTDQQPNTAALKTLQPVIRDLKKIYGDINFHVMDSLSLVSETGSRALLNGQRTRVEQLVQYNQNQINAQIDITFQGPVHQSLGVRISLKHGEFLVLGESSVQSQDSSGQMFYIVSWP